MCSYLYHDLRPEHDSQAGMGLRNKLREVACQALARDGRTMSAGAFMKGGDRMDTVLVFNAICNYLERQHDDLDSKMLAEIAAKPEEDCE